MLALALLAGTLVCTLGAAGSSSSADLVTIVRLEQARSLGDGQLAAFLNGSDRALAARAALAIGRTKQPAGLPLLVVHAADSDTTMRATAVYGIGLIGGAAAVAPVLTALHDAVPQVQIAALDAFDRLGTANTLPRADRRADAAIVAALLAGTAPPSVRARAATTLEVFAPWAEGDYASRALVAAFAKEPDPIVRWHIMWTVFRAYPVRVPREFLANALRDTDETVRIEASRALGRVKSRSAIAVLQPMLADPSWRVREQTLESIRQLSAQAPTDHLKAIPNGVSTPAPLPDPFANEPALPRSGAKLDAKSATAPVAQNAILTAGVHPRLRIVTTQGNVYVELYPEWAPLTVENFMYLSDGGYYDDNPWFRIVPDFVVQTGAGASGQDDVKYMIGAEENPIEQDSYVISMGLNYTDPPNAHALRDSAGSEFYITLSPQLHLNRDFTVFGRVIGGADVLGHLIETDKIVRIERIADATR